MVYRLIYWVISIQYVRVSRGACIGVRFTRKVPLYIDLCKSYISTRIIYASSHISEQDYYFHEKN